MQAENEYLRPAGVVMTLPDPRSKKYAMDGQRGGTCQWRTETHDHPTFEISFEGLNPFDEVTDQIFRGSDLAPVVLRLNSLGEFRYNILQMGVNGEVSKSGPHTFNVRECRGCNP